MEIIYQVQLRFYKKKMLFMTQKWYYIGIISQYIKHSTIKIKKKYKTSEKTVGSELIQWRYVLSEWGLWDIFWFFFQ